VSPAPQVVVEGLSHGACANRVCHTLDFGKDKRLNPVVKLNYLVTMFINKNHIQEDKQITFGKCLLQFDSESFIVRFLSKGT
jgi:hypothetical protein